MGPKQEQVSLSLHVAKGVHHCEDLCKYRRRNKEKEEREYEKRRKDR